MNSSLIFASLASLCWAIAPIIGAPAARELGSFQFTRVRTAITAVVLGSFAIANDAFAQIPAGAFAYLIGSSFIGIATGDFLLFHALKVLGPRRSSILYSLNVPATAVIAFLFLGEVISRFQLFGFVTASVGISIATAFRAANTAEERAAADVRIGVLAGIGSAICQSVGIVLAKPAFELGVNVAAAASIRLAAAALILHLPLIFSGNLAGAIPRAGRETLLRAVGAALIGSCLGILFLMISLSTGKTTLTSLFASLSPLLMLPLLRIMGRERPRLLAWVGGVTAMIGLALILASPANAATVRISMIYPSTGKEADFVCISRALAEAKRKGLRHEYILKQFDNGQDVVETAKVLSQIIAEQPLAVVGTRTSQEAIVAAKSLDQAKLPFVAPISAHPDVTKNHPWTLRIVGDSTTYARLWARYTTQVAKAQRVATVTNLSLPYSVDYVRAYRAALKDSIPLQNAADFEMIDGVDTYDALATKIVASKADTLFLAMYAEHVVPLVEALGRHGASLSILSTGGMNDGAAMLAATMAKAPGIRFVYNGVWNKTAQGKDSALYQQLMRERCAGQPDSMRSVLAFDAMNEVIAAAERESNPTRESVAKVLRRPGKRLGISGSYEVVTDGSTIRPIELYSIDKDGTKYVDSYE